MAKGQIKRGPRQTPQDLRRRDTGGESRGKATFSLLGNSVDVDTINQNQEKGVWGEENSLVEQIYFELHRGHGEIRMKMLGR